VILREITDDDRPQLAALGRLAFGGDRDAPLAPPPPPGSRRAYAAFDDRGVVQASITLKPYQQWWGGRGVPKVGVAGVAVRPEARGQGLVGRLLGLGLADHDQPLSVLYPTAPAIYRRRGWEVVGTLDTTHLPIGLLPATGSVRAATAEDAPAVAALYDAVAASTNGLLARPAPSFDADVVSLAEEAGTVTGYVSYQRESGYSSGGQLVLRELLATTPMAMTALLGSLGSWSSVVDTVVWRGKTAPLALALGVNVPAPAEVQPWMLRVLDPVAAVDARGFAPGTWSLPVTVAGSAYRLEVADGRGTLTEGSAGPELTEQGFALLYAGASAGTIVRSGHGTGDLTALTAAFAGPEPEILDYF
jgi:predicted acetyltransferase